MDRRGVRTVPNTDRIRKSDSVDKSPYNIVHKFKMFPPISSAKFFRIKLLKPPESFTVDGYERLRSMLLKISNEQRIPQEIIELYIAITESVPMRRAYKFMKKEIEGLQRQTAAVQVALDAYESWKLSLRSLEEKCRHIATDISWKQNPKLFRELLEILSNHSYITLNFVESVLVWERKLKNYTLRMEGRIDLVSNGENVLEGVLESCDFLLDCGLGSLFLFSARDPFLLGIAKDMNSRDIIIRTPRSSYSSNSRSKKRMFINIEKEPQKRMRELQLLLLQRGVTSPVKLSRKYLGKKNLNNEVSKISKKTLESISKMICEEIWNEAQRDFIANSLVKFLNGYLAQAIFNKLVPDEIYKQIKEISKSGYKEESIFAENQRVFNLENLQIFDQITQDYIELIFLEENIQEICENIYDNLVEEHRISKEIKLSIENAQLRENIIESYIEYFLDSYDYEKLIQKILKAARNQAELERMGNLRQMILQISQEISQDFIESILERFSLNIGTDSYQSALEDQHESEKLISSSLNAKNLQMIQIQESIYRSLIEVEINSLNLRELSESILVIEVASNAKSSLEFNRLSSNIEILKLTEQISSEIIEEFINNSWLQKLADNVRAALKPADTIFITANNLVAPQPEDFVMEIFTPGVHSPNEVSFISRNSDPQPIEDLRLAETPWNMNLSFKALQSISTFSLISLDTRPHHLLSVIEAYSDNIPIELKSLWPVNSSLLESISLCFNSKYFWILSDNIACGLLVYSENSEGLVINHASLTNSSYLPKLFLCLPELIGFGKYDVRIRFLRRPSADLISEFVFIKELIEVLDQLQFRECEENDRDYVLDGEEIRRDRHIRVKAFAHVVMNEERVESHKEANLDLGQVGNRNCLLGVLSNILRNNENSQVCDDSDIRLQNDLAEILEILLCTSENPYKFIQNYMYLSNEATKSFIKNTSYLTGDSYNNCISALNLNFNIPSCRHTSHSVCGEEYKYIQVPSSKISVQRGMDNCILFRIQLENPDLSIFLLKSEDFLEELTENSKIRETDLFYDISEFLKTFSDPIESNMDLWVPCFWKDTQSELLWAKGFWLETDEKKIYVEKCWEGAEIMIDYQGTESITLDLKTTSKVIIEGPFIFGVISQSLYELLEIPLFVAVIRDEDLIEVNV